MENAITKTIDGLKGNANLSGVDVANITGVSKATVSRWSSGKAVPHPKMQLVLSDLRYVVDKLSEFYTPDETRIWLYARNDLLNGERAIQMIHSDRTDEVLSAIESLGSMDYI
ncbi:MAG: helix-turn-helix transcriptional regulator [Gammaproteobacteria bacterium]|nr:helix-turn-helix transcriptional regulator [Gammaproteobacteria bacterium]